MTAPPLPARHHVHHLPTSAPFLARRIGGACVIVAYLAASAWFLYLHVLGDVGWHPVTYFFTWDMFPGYSTTSARRVVVGQTQSRRYVQLIPGPNEQFRWGVAGDLPRFDILPAVDQGPPVERLMDAIDAALARTHPQHIDDPIVFVDILEEYRPSHFNLPEDLYRQEYGVDRPERRYWRSLGSARVDLATNRIIRNSGARDGGSQSAAETETR